MQRDTGTRTGSPAPELWRTIFTLWGKDLPQAILLVCMQADSWGKPMTRCLPVSHNVVLSDCTLVLRIGCSLNLERRSHTCVCALLASADIGTIAMASSIQGYLLT